MLKEKQELGQNAFSKTMMQIKERKKLFRENVLNVAETEILITTCQLRLQPIGLRTDLRKGNIYAITFFTIYIFNK